MLKDAGLGLSRPCLRNFEEGRGGGVGGALEGQP